MVNEKEYSKGIYDKKNKLNNLTGKEWKFATKSVLNKQYPPNIQFRLRKEHGGQKPPELCKELIEIFTKKGQTVLDPLMGVGGTLLGASLCNRKAIGMELNPRWIEIYNDVCKLENLNVQKTYLGDCNELLKNDSFLKHISFVDLILTDVPYWDMDKVKQTRSKKSFRTNLSKFNENESQSKEDWLNEMKLIFEKAERILKDQGYMLIFIGDMYKSKEYHLLSAELARKISEISSLTLKASLIWYDVSKSLHVYGYPYSFVPSIIHQNVLVFKKEQL